MPKAVPKRVTTPQRRKELVKQRLRNIIAEAYAAVVADQFNVSISAVTLEEMAQEQIEQIEGKDGITAIRPNRLTEVDRIANELQTAVELAKSLDPTYFQNSASDAGRIKDVANTEE